MEGFSPVLRGSTCGCETDATGTVYSTRSWRLSVSSRSVLLYGLTRFHRDFPDLTSDDPCFLVGIFLKTWGRLEAAWDTLFIPKPAVNRPRVILRRLLNGTSSPVAIFPAQSGWAVFNRDFPIEVRNSYYDCKKS